MQLKFLWEEIQSKSINICDIYAMKDEVTIRKITKKGSYKAMLFININAKILKNIIS